MIILLDVDNTLLTIENDKDDIEEYKNLNSKKFEIIDQENNKAVIINLALVEALVEIKNKYNDIEFYFFTKMYFNSDIFTDRDTGEIIHTFGRKDLINFLQKKGIEIIKVVMPLDILPDFSPGDSWEKYFIPAHNAENFEDLTIIKTEVNSKEKTIKNYRDDYKLDIKFYMFKKLLTVLEKDKIFFFDDKVECIKDVLEAFRGASGEDIKEEEFYINGSITEGNLKLGWHLVDMSIDTSDTTDNYLLSVERFILGDSETVD